MFDFYLGSKEEIAGNEENYLLSIKRMLPRWLNSIPDSEYIALHRLLNENLKKERPILVETGVGASTIVLLYHAFKNNGMLFSWDTANPKGAELRNICHDTLCQYFDQNLWHHWKFIAYHSHSQHLGIPVLNEFGVHVDFCFLDSEHTWENLGGEIKKVAPFLRPGSVLSIDDANYNFKHTNTAYINMFRKKLGLDPVGDHIVQDNECTTFAQETHKLLQELFPQVTPLQDDYENECRNDIFFTYYSNEREHMNSVGMEKLDHLELRFKAWKIG